MLAKKRDVPNGEAVEENGRRAVGKNFNGYGLPERDSLHDTSEKIAPFSMTQVS
jgi:hypothetical protein